MATQLQNIGEALAGFSAGIGGQLPQFAQQQGNRAYQQQQVEMQQQKAMQEQQARQQEAAIERQKTMYTDANAALGFAEKGEWDTVVQLGVNRLELLQNFPDADPSDTQRITQLALAARNGNEEAAELVKDELKTAVDIGRSLGIIATPEPPKGATDLGKLQQDLNAGLITPEQYEQAVAATSEGMQPTLQRVSGIVGNEQQPSTLLMNSKTGEFTRQMPDGSVETIPSSMITQVSVQGAMGDVLPPTRSDDLRGTRDWLQYQQEDIGRMLERVRADPSLVGAPGAIRRAGQTVMGAATDLGSLFGSDGAAEASKFTMDTANNALQMVDTGRMSEEQFNKLFNDPTLSELRLFENSLGFTLAQLRSPDQRMLATVINRSLEDAKLTGLTSSADVINRLEAIHNQFDSRIDSLNRRIGDDAPTRTRQPAEQPAGPPAGVAPEVWEVMTPEERALWQN
jgi:hypothetical protein